MISDHSASSEDPIGTGMNCILSNVSSLMLDFLVIVIYNEIDYVADCGQYSCHQCVLVFPLLRLLTFLTYHLIMTFFAVHFLTVS